MNLWTGFLTIRPSDWNARRPLTESNRTIPQRSICFIDFEFWLYSCACDLPSFVVVHVTSQNAVTQFLLVRRGGGNPNHQQSARFPVMNHVIGGKGGINISHIWQLRDYDFIKFTITQGETSAPVLSRFLWIPIFIG